MGLKIPLKKVIRRKTLERILQTLIFTLPKTELNLCKSLWVRKNLIF